MRGDALLAERQHLLRRLRLGEQRLCRFVDTDIGRLGREHDGDQQGERVRVFELGLGRRPGRGEAAEELGDLGVLHGDGCRVEDVVDSKARTSIWLPASSITRTRPAAERRGVGTTATLLSRGHRRPIDSAKRGGYANHAASGDGSMWNQVYDPFSNSVLSTIAAALPVVTLLVLIASNKVKAHIAAVIALVVANLVAIVIFTMPANMSIRATVLGAITGFFPIGWIVLNVIFLYRLTVEKGVFQTLQTTIGGVTTDRRLQLLLIAFCFGAFFEGASGFGTPVAVTGAILIGLGFSPLAASGLSLIANTAPVAYGALGTPIAGLASVTGIDPFLLGAMVGRQLPFFSLIVPFWLIWVFAGRRGMMQIWPAILVCGVSFAVPQYLISNFVNPWIVDIGASLISMACLIGFLKVWQPKEIWTSPALRSHDESAATMPKVVPSTKTFTTAETWAAFIPWIIVCAILLIWGTGWFKAWVNPFSTWNYPVPDLHNLINKVPPVAARPTPEGAVFSFTWLSYTGSGMLIAAIISGFVMGFSPLKIV